MSLVSPDRRRHDDRKRGADAELHTDFFGNPEKAEHLEQHRNDNSAAANPEQSGEQPGNDSGGHHRDRNPDQFADWRPCHGSAATVAPQQPGQLGDALPFLAAINGVLDAAYPLRAQHNAC